MKKKIAVIALLCVMCLLLSSCGGFSIVGTWRSVGSYGFGQAQPGAIVTFDKDTCNFFSPMDTYLLTKEEGQYWLNTTSLLGISSMSFKLDVVDNDHIKVYYNGTTTELKRIK